MKVKGRLLGIWKKVSEVAREGHRGGEYDQSML
jgi:hypothetical protein